MGLKMSNEALLPGLCEVILGWRRLWSVTGLMVFWNATGLTLSMKNYGASIGDSFVTLQSWGLLWDVDTIPQTFPLGKLCNVIMMLLQNMPSLVLPMEHYGLERVAEAAGISLAFLTAKPNQSRGTFYWLVNKDGEWGDCGGRQGGHRGSSAGSLFTVRSASKCSG